MSAQRLIQRGSAVHWVCAAILAVACTGCFVDQFQPAEDGLVVLTGTDSAGAAIDVTIQKGGPAKARVSDVVLGKGEAEIVESLDQWTFTITFPAGVAITYTAQTPDQLGAVPDAIEGLWMQHAGGVFGEDTGDWTVTRAVQAEK